MECACGLSSAPGTITPPMGLSKRKNFLPKKILIIQKERWIDFFKNREINNHDECTHFNRITN